LKNERIRNYVLNSTSETLFDYADILCWSDAGALATTTWSGNGTERTFPVIHPDNMLDMNGGYLEDGDRIGQRGALRLAKAMWVMLARMTGWEPSGGGTMAATTETSKKAAGQPQSPAPGIVDGKFGFGFPTEVGLVYVVEFKESISDSNWTQLEEIEGEGSYLTVSDPEGLRTARYYRVRLK
jgi:hypothetical protein